MASDASWLKDHIRDIPDFPKPGVVFKDITPLLADVDAFRFAVDAVADHFAGGREVHKVLGVEARGFIIAAPVIGPIQVLPTASPTLNPSNRPSGSTARRLRAQLTIG